MACGKVVLERTAIQLEVLFIQHHLVFAIMPNFTMSRLSEADAQYEDNSED
ncbi:MAG: hypothetical protein VX026_11140 [Myxococcota bacterium]|nr:hypothetical protein [Myxococcota bacterium]